MCISSIYCLSQYSHNISRCYLEAIFPSPRYNYNVVLIIEINKRTGLNFKVERQYITVGHLPFLLWGLWIMGQWWGAFVWKKSRFFFHPLWTTKTNSPFTSTGGRKKLDISKNEWQNLHIIKYNVLYMKKKTFFFIMWVNLLYRYNRLKQLMPLLNPLILSMILQYYTLSFVQR